MLTISIPNKPICNKDKTDFLINENIINQSNPSNKKQKEKTHSLALKEMKKK